MGLQAQLTDASDKREISSKHQENAITNPTSRQRLLKMAPTAQVRATTNARSTNKWVPRDPGDSQKCEGGPEAPWVRSGY